MVTTIESFIKKLEPLGVYDISEGTNICAELSAYAEALDKHRENMDEALRECFISTAEGYGIEIREKVFGQLRERYTNSKRREMLSLRRSLGENDFTRAGLDRFMASLGVDSYSLQELYGTYTIIVTISNTFTDTEAKWIEKQIKEIMPAHLITLVYYGGSTFSEIDAENLTYSAFDNRNSTWAEIDNLD